MDLEARAHRRGLLISCCLIGCSPAPTSLIEIQDPNNVAAKAVELVFEVRAEDDALYAAETRELSKGFPVTITVSAAEERSVEVTVTALDSNDEPIARGHVNALLARSTTPITLKIGPSCESDCDDGLFCNGVERCERGVCLRSAAPCRANFPCVLTTCSEETDECSTRVDHQICEENDGNSRYCSPDSGCILGAPCTEDSECQDGLACNGTERCVNFTCSAGVPPNPDDGSPCTVDGCNDARDTEPLFNIQDPTKDGSACDLPDGGTGICLSSSSDICLPSRCGDGFHDPFREPCDDGDDDNTDGCTRTPSDSGGDGYACALARCGDGFIQQGVEVCDDQNTASGDGCRGDCLKIELCGDGELDAGEACDDGNDNPNDGCHACRTTEWRASVITGLGDPAGDALDLRFRVEDLTVDREGNIFIASARVWRIDAATGIPSIVAGSGDSEFSGDGGPATSAGLDAVAVAVDGLGNLFIADESNHRIRQVCAGDSTCPAGTIRTVAGTETGGYSGDGGDATQAQLSRPGDVAVDGLGNLFIADTSNMVVRKVCAGDSNCAPGTIHTLAGNGTRGASGDQGPAVAAQLDFPQSIAIDQRGNVYIAELHRIRQVCVDTPDCPTGTIRRLAGQNDQYPWGFADGPALESRLSSPSRIEIDATGNLVIADTNNTRIRQLCLNDTDCEAGTIRTVAGRPLSNTLAFSGDGGPAVEAHIGQPTGISVDPSGNVYFSNLSNGRIRKICIDGATCESGTINTVAGSGFTVYPGDGRPAKSARLSSPYDVATDDAGHLYIVDRFNHLIRRTCVPNSPCQDETIATIAGNGSSKFSGDGGLATEAGMSPSKIAVDAAGNVYITDFTHHRVRKVCAGDEQCAAGTIQTFAGTGEPGDAGDGGMAINAHLNGPLGIALDTDGNVYIADNRNGKVRKVCVGSAGCPSGTIHTIAGGGVGDGDNVPATSIRLVLPRSLVIDPLGNIIVAEYFSRVRRICVNYEGCESGHIQTVAGTGDSGYSGDGGPATLAKLRTPDDVAIDRDGNILIASGRRIRRVCKGAPGCPEGFIQTVVGNGDLGSGGDMGPAIDAELYSPSAIDVDVAGNWFIADWQTHLIRQVCVGEPHCPPGTIRTLVGEIHPGDGPLGRSSLGEPAALARLGSEWLVADGVSGRVRKVDPSRDWLSTVVGHVNGFASDGAPADLSRLLARPMGIAVDPMAERFFVSESQGHTIRAVDTSTDDWTVSTFAGTGDPEFADGAGTAAAFSSPAGLLFDEANNRLLVVDRDNHIVRAIDPMTGSTTTLAGTPRTKGFSGDGGPATRALLNSPEAIALAPDGALYISDSQNHRVRRVDVSGQIETVLGDGVAASSGEGGFARLFPVNRPRGLAIDSYGNLFVTSSTALRFVPAGEDNVATGDDPVSTIYGSTPRDVFPASVTNCLSDISLTENNVGIPEARLMVLDACLGFMLALDREVQ